MSIDLKTFQSAFYNPNINQVEKVRPLKAMNKIFGELNTVSRVSVFNPNEITTELKNKMGKTLGRETFFLNPESRNASGSLISVETEYRQKGHKFGEILRLSSIIMMLENCIKNFEIYSRNTAIFFHALYKFEPNITQFKERNEALESVISNCRNNGPRYDQIREEAEELLEEAHEDKSLEKQRELCVDTNALLSRYINKVLETKGEYLSHPFKTGIFMKLTDKSIKENKEFFNDLLEKHQIDYRI